MNKFQNGKYFLKFFIFYFLKFLNFYILIFSLR